MAYYKGQGLLLDVLYALDKSEWSVYANSLLEVFNCIVDIDKSSKTYTINEFLYLELNIKKYLSQNEKQALNCIKTLSIIYIKGISSAIQCYAINIDSDYKNRNDLLADITKYFYYTVGKKCILLFCDNNSCAFTGACINLDKKNLDIYISEWFEYEMTDEKYYQFLEIDFSEYSLDSPQAFYSDYLYSIARPYERYKESKQYLMYACDAYVEIDEETRQVDWESKYLAAKSYYKDLYEYDYFENCSQEPLEEEQEDEELKWTLLEMELESLNIEKELEENDEFEEDEEIDESNLYESDEIDFDNPEDMLERIRKRRKVSIF